MTAWYKCRYSHFAALQYHLIVSRYRQNELKEGAQRSVGRQYYYIDYKQFCDVVKWRIAEMRRIIDSGLRNVSLRFSLPDALKHFMYRNLTTKATSVRSATKHTHH